MTSDNKGLLLLLLSIGATGEDTRIVIDNKSLSLLHIRYVDGDRISPGFTD